MTAISLRDVPFSRPEFDRAEADAVAAVLATGWVSQGPRVAEFEALFAERRRPQQRPLDFCGEAQIPIDARD